jgi:hypothetical protein
MNRTFQKLVFMVLLLAIVPSVSAVPRQGEREYVGAMNNSIRIRMKLAQNGRQINGSYIYEKVGKPLQLRGTVSGQQITLTETDANGNHTGTFKGRFVTADLIEGSWTNPEGTKTMPFNVKAITGGPAHSPSSSDILSGEYARVDAKGRIEKNSGASINVNLHKDGSAEIQGDASLVIDAKRGNVRTGTVEGKYNLRGNKLLVKGASAYDCSLLITFGKGTLTVTDDNGNCGGLGVSFNGDYKRIGSPKFEKRDN